MNYLLGNDHLNSRPDALALSRFCPDLWKRYVERVRFEAATERNVTPKEFAERGAIFRLAAAA